LRSREGQQYTYAGVLDADLIFQADIFAALSAVRTAEAHAQSTYEIHLMSESVSPSVKNNMLLHGTPPGHLSLAKAALKKTDGQQCSGPQWPQCHCAWSATLPPTPASPHPTPVGANRSTSRRFWKLHGKTYPVNVGTTFGTRDALATLLERIFDALRPGLASTSTRAAAQLLPRGAETGIAEGCWEQGVLNVLAYTVAASAQPRAWASCVKDGLPAR